MKCLNMNLYSKFLSRENGLSTRVHFSAVMKAQGFWREDSKPNSKIKLQNLAMKTSQKFSKKGFHEEGFSRACFFLIWGFLRPLFVKLENKPDFMEDWTWRRVVRLSNFSKGFWKMYKLRDTSLSASEILHLTFIFPWLSLLVGLDGVVASRP